MTSARTQREVFVIRHGETEWGSRFLLDTSTLSILGHYRGIPTVKRWNAPFFEGRTS